MDLVFFVWHKEGSMEHVMDLPHFREVELVCDGRQDFDNCEGSFTFGGELWVSNRAFQIPSFQLDFVAFGERSESSVVV